MKTFPVQLALSLRMKHVVLTSLVLLCGLSSFPAIAQTQESRLDATASEAPAPAVESSHQIIRDVNGSGGRAMKGSSFTLHGTVSQTTIGRLQRPNPAKDQHNVGFWYWAKQVNSFACVRMPIVEAEPGTTLTIPVLIEQTERIPVSATLRFKARIRFNRSLLQLIGQTAACTFDGNDCILEIDVPVTSQSLENGVLTELRFLAKLGNAESTPLIIEDYAWTGFGEQPIQTVAKPGEFVLLGICRVGGEIRLIQSTGPASRIRVWPNPAVTNANVEFMSKEDGIVRLSLVDAIGRELTVFSEQSVEAMKLYRADLDLSTIPSGSYFLVLRTPSEVKTTRITIEQ